MPDARMMVNKADGVGIVLDEGPLSGPYQIDPAADPLVIQAPGGRVLLRFGPNGEFEGEIEDMGEAAELFVRAVRESLGGGAGA